MARHAALGPNDDLSHVPSGTRESFLMPQDFVQPPGWQTVPYTTTGRNIPLLAEIRHSTAYPAERTFNWDGVQTPHPPRLHDPRQGRSQPQGRPSYNARHARPEDSVNEALSSPRIATPRYAGGAAMRNQVR